MTGGLFLGDAARQRNALTGHFPDSQDQRNTVRGRVRYQVNRASGSQGEFSMTPDCLSISRHPSAALAEYGQQVVDRINFARGRIDPAFQVNASAGADVYKSERMTMRFQIDGQNLDNVLDVIDFGGLFSGNAIGPSRSVALRLPPTSSGGQTRKPRPLLSVA